MKNIKFNTETKEIVYCLDSDIQVYVDADAVENGNFEIMQVNDDEIDDSTKIMPDVLYDRYLDFINNRDQEELLKTTRIEMLRAQYRTSTNRLCEIAEAEIVDKLEDVNYEAVSGAAMANNPAETSVLTQTIMYCLFQLYRVDGDDAWDNI